MSFNKKRAFFADMQTLAGKKMNTRDKRTNVSFVNVSKPVLNILTLFKTK